MSTGSLPQPTPPEPELFRCETSCEPQSARILAIGELDVSAEPILSAEIEALRGAGYRRLIVDLSRLAFIDSTGLRCLLDYHAEARRDGFTIDLIRGPETVQRVFELTGTLTHLRFIDQ